MKKQTYIGDIRIGTATEWEQFIKKYDGITGSIYMQGCTGLTSVTFPKETGYIDMQGCTGLTSVTFPDKVSGYIYMQGCTGLTSVTFPKETGSIYMQGCTGLTSVTFPDKVSGYIYLDDKSSDYLLSLQHKKIICQLNDVNFDRKLFDSVRFGQLSAADVFSISNMEQRRVAYERLDKIKIKELDGLTVVDRIEDDGCGYPMQIISFTLPRVNQPFLYLNCFCPSSGREYYLETQETDCWTAKAASFGLSDVEWVAEY